MHLKKGLQGIAQIGARIVNACKEVLGYNIALDTLRILIAIQGIEILSETNKIPSIALTKSHFFQMYKKDLHFCLEISSVKKEVVEILDFIFQSEARSDLNAIFSALRDIVWRIPAEMGEKTFIPNERHLKKDIGIYETPQEIANFIFLFIKSHLNEFHTVLEPACGSGNLLAPFWLEASQIVTYAIDTDELGLLLAEVNFLSQIQFRNEESIAFRPLQGDFLTQTIQPEMDVIVSNPPWGISPHHLQHFDRAEFSVSFTQQVDSWALFLEKAITVLKSPVGILAFIIPNTLCLNPNFEQIRTFLIEKTKILFILNLGEGIFPLVTQPALLIIMQKASPPQDHEIWVKIFPGQMGSDHHLKELTAWLPKTPVQLASFLASGEHFNQLKFLRNPGSRLEIFASEIEMRLIEKICEHSHSTFADFVTNARGVEIGKRAEVILCPHCKQWNPPPKWRKQSGKDVAKCTHCQEQLENSPFLQKLKIIEPSLQKFDHASSNATEVIVGEQVSQFSIHGCNFIQNELKGINYKVPQTYKSPKILIRKTGREIFAAIDWNHRMTVQVVYIFQMKSPLLNAIPIEILLCLLNSHLLLFYYYHRFGDPEKRNYTHYIQKYLKSLPIPDTIGSNITALNAMHAIIQKYPKFGQEGIEKADQDQLNAIIETLYRLTSQEKRIIQDWVDNF